MAGGEFSLIEQYFQQPAAKSGTSYQPLLGIGDDAAVSQLPADHLLVQTIDTLIEGRHFTVGTAPADIAHKALAVNVSDLVAMAASPWTFLLSLSLPSRDQDFLQPFSNGLFAAAKAYGITLIGGDTCRGDLSITIQANGYVNPDQYVTRQGARPGDTIFVSGHLGAAALALAHLQGHVALGQEDEAMCMKALNRPSPRTDLIAVLRDYASAAIDVSDGLVSDLGHILKQSRVGAVLQKSQIPVPEAIKLKHTGHFSKALTGGDDYQLVFTVRENNVSALMAEVTAKGIDITPVGEITESCDFVLMEQRSRIDLKQFLGFDHFGA